MVLQTQMLSEARLVTHVCEEAPGCKAIGSGGEFTSYFFSTVPRHLSIKMFHFFLSSSIEGKIGTV